MPDHIKIRTAPGTYVVRAGGAVLGETSRALELSEGDYPPVIYFPREDLAMAFLDKTDTVSVCPFKGEATYYAIHTKSVVIADAAWSYEDPKPLVAGLKDYIAFYPRKAAVEQL
ncbi:DUF427 domain-containing protein [Celeribacter baekdonensis]|jgi:uncharacterized protein (DUF427 family)|uniref:DUF427 domain-containing protein n=1 Tax=Celeribacter baekdonensis TaxID=875171 RepID=A0A2R4M2S5_9RHOB|nr:DUF427 domain-containing protein [Celeribacter baekdonensis]AVW91514.1 hypothetical protein DA792_10820 [Celeribacter baekdonensis]|tara:strand:+ start:121723 stop:122064 length:342 start_codon:yes stop_codon:yes gene_type:complete